MKNRRRAITSAVRFVSVYHTYINGRNIYVAYKASYRVDRRFANRQTPFTVIPIHIQPFVNELQSRRGRHTENVSPLLAFSYLLFSAVKQMTTQQRPIELTQAGGCHDNHQRNT